MHSPTGSACSCLCHAVCCNQMLCTESGSGFSFLFFCLFFCFFFCLFFCFSCFFFFFFFCFFLFLLVFLLLFLLLFLLEETKEKTPQGQPGLCCPQGLAHGIRLTFDTITQPAASSAQAEADESVFGKCITGSQVLPISDLAHHIHNSPLPLQHHRLWYKAKWEPAVERVRACVGGAGHCSPGPQARLADGHL